MSGYIEYTDTSPLSPVYPRPIEIGGTSYTSAHHAIQSGEEPSEVILILVRNNRSVYYPHRYYIFQGTYSDLLNRAIASLFIPKREVVDVGRYIYILDGDLLTLARNIPVEFSVPIIRNVYITSNQGNNIYQQTQALDTIEIYNVFLIENIPLYVGSMGAFFTLDDREQDISLALSSLRL